jgi:hypothetical protein
VADETGESRGLVTQAAESAGEAISEPAKSREAEVAEFDVLEVLPQSIDRIEFRSVTGQPLQLETRGRPSGQKGADGLATVSRQPIPDDQELARNLAEQMLQKADDGVPACPSKAWRCIWV